MKFDELHTELSRLYDVSPRYDHMSIGTGIRFDSDGMSFRFYMEEDKYYRITSATPFDEWMACALRDGWRSCTGQIQKIGCRFGVQWDPEEGILFIRFRRNEMSVSQAFFRLQQAMRIIGEINGILVQE